MENNRQISTPSTENVDSVLRKSTTSYSNQKGPLSTKGPSFLAHADTGRKNSWPILRGEFSFWYRTFFLIYNLCYFQFLLKIVVIYHLKQFVRPMQNILCKFCDLKNLVKTKILENFEFVFWKEDIHRLISSTELFLSDIRGLRYTGLKRVNFFVGHPVDILTL